MDVALCASNFSGYGSGILKKTDGCCTGLNHAVTSSATSSALMTTVTTATTVMMVTTATTVTATMATVTATVTSPHQPALSTSGGTAARTRLHRGALTPPTHAFPTGSFRTPGVPVGATEASSKLRSQTAMVSVASTELLSTPNGRTCTELIYRCITIIILKDFW